MKGEDTHKLKREDGQKKGSGPPVFTKQVLLYFICRWPSPSCPATPSPSRCELISCLSLQRRPEVEKKFSKFSKNGTEMSCSTKKILSRRFWGQFINSWEGQWVKPRPGLSSKDYSSHLTNKSKILRLERNKKLWNGLKRNKTVLLQINLIFQSRFVRAPNPECQIVIYRSAKFSEFGSWSPVWCHMIIGEI